MKSNIHPKYFETSVTCACGNTFVTGGTRKSLFIEVCYKCHPLFTGEERLVDMKGQVEKFRAKMEIAKSFADRPKKEDKKHRSQTVQKSLKDLLASA